MKKIISILIVTTMLFSLFITTASAETKYPTGITMIDFEGTNPFDDQTGAAVVGEEGSKYLEITATGESQTFNYDMNVPNGKFLYFTITAKNITSDMSDGMGFNIAPRYRDGETSTYKTISAPMYVAKNGGAITASYVSSSSDYTNGKTTPNATTEYKMEVIIGNDAKNPVCVTYVNGERYSSGSITNDNATYVGYSVFYRLALSITKTVGEKIEIDNIGYKIYNGSSDTLDTVINDITVYEPEYASEVPASANADYYPAMTGFTDFEDMDTNTVFTNNNSTFSLIKGFGTNCTLTVRQDVTGNKYAELATTAAVDDGRLGYYIGKLYRREANAASPVNPNNRFLYLTASVSGLKNNASEGTFAFKPFPNSARVSAPVYQMNNGTLYVGSNTDMASRPDLLTENDHMYKIDMIIDLTTGVHKVYVDGKYYHDFTSNDQYSASHTMNYFLFEFVRNSNTTFKLDNIGYRFYSETNPCISQTSLTSDAMLTDIAKNVLAKPYIHYVNGRKFAADDKEGVRFGIRAQGTKDCGTFVIASYDNSNNLITVSDLENHKDVNGENIIGKYSPDMDYELYDIREANVAKYSLIDHVKVFFLDSINGIKPITDYYKVQANEFIPQS